jgi:hypothetical protein
MWYEWSLCREVDVCLRKTTWENKVVSKYPSVENGMVSSNVVSATCSRGLSLISRAMQNICIILVRRIYLGSKSFGCDVKLFHCVFGYTVVRITLLQKKVSCNTLSRRRGKTGSRDGYDGHHPAYPQAKADSQHPCRIYKLLRTCDKLLTLYKSKRTTRCSKPNDSVMVGATCKHDTQSERTKHP